MKKLLVILLVAISAFNGFGYRVLVSWLEDRANKGLEIALDKNEYNSKDEIVLKVPNNLLSYYNSSLEFNRQDGSIEIDGNPYRFVKMRLFGDSVEIVCIPDYPARNSLAIQEHFVKWNTDTQQTSASKKSGSHHGAYKIIAVEFDTAGHQAVPPICFSIVSKKIPHFLSDISSMSTPVLENPPESFCS